MAKKTLYIAGPMTGYMDSNYPAFQRASRLLRACGHGVFCPADIDEMNPNPCGHPIDYGKEDGELCGQCFNRTWQWYMRHAVAMLLRADAVALLPGSTTSRGAQIEIRLARDLGMDVRQVFEWINDDLIGELLP